MLRKALEVLDDGEETALDDLPVNAVVSFKCDECIPNESFEHHQELQEHLISSHSKTICALCCEKVSVFDLTVHQKTQCVAIERNGQSAQQPQSVANEFRCDTCSEISKHKRQKYATLRDLLFHQRKTGH